MKPAPRPALEAVAAEEAAPSMVARVERVAQEGAAPGAVAVAVARTTAKREETAEAVVPAVLLTEASITTNS